MLSNLLPYLTHHFGESVKTCFTPSAVERLQDCTWDPVNGNVVGAYDDEIAYLDEDDIMSQYIATKKSTTTTATSPHTPTKPSPTPTNPPTLQNTAYGNDEDSVSTLGNNTARKWSGAPSPSPLKSPFPVPHSITHSTQPPPPSDDRSLGSVSTLNTRINSIEGQFQELSGTMEHIKNMLQIIANPQSTQVEEPRTLDRAGRGDSTGGPS